MEYIVKQFSFDYLKIGQFFYLQLMSLTFMVLLKKSSVFVILNSEQNIFTFMPVLGGFGGFE